MTHFLSRCGMSGRGWFCISEWRRRGRRWSRYRRRQVPSLCRRRHRRRRRAGPTRHEQMMGCVWNGHGHGYKHEKYELSSGAPEEFRLPRFVGREGIVARARARARARDGGRVAGWAADHRVAGRRVARLRRWRSLFNSHSGRRVSVGSDSGWRRWVAREKLKDRTHVWPVAHPAMLLGLRNQQPHGSRAVKLS